MRLRPRLGPSAKYLGFSVLPGFERERGSTSSAFGRSVLSFFFQRVGSLIGTWLEKWWKFFKMARKMMVFDQSRKVPANFLFARHAFQTFLLRLLKHRCSEISRWRGGRGGRERSPQLRGNGIRGKQEEETIFNVSAKFHEILNFEYLSGETLVKLLLLYRGIERY